MAWVWVAGFTKPFDVQETRGEVTDAAHLSPLIELTVAHDRKLSVKSEWIAAVEDPAVTRGAVRLQGQGRA